MAVHLLICNRNKNKAHYSIQACKFLQIQKLETEIISLLFVSESGTLIEKLSLISTLCVQVETDIQRGVVELYYDTPKAMDVDSDSDADSI